MKIGIVLLSSGWAGAERVVYQLAKMLSRIKGVKVYLIINNEISKYYRDINGVSIQQIGLFNKGSSLINLYKIRKRIKNLVKTKGIRVINSHMELSNFVSPRSSNHINVFHGADLRELKKSPSIRHRLMIKPKIHKNLSSSSKIISVSAHQIKNLPEKYKKKTSVISNGVDTEEFKPLKNIKQRKNVILFVGRIIDWKGIYEILEVSKKLSQYEFWFVGRGPLEGLINLPNTKYLGFKTTEELIKLYNESTLCIFPSWYEPFGLVGLEAMACGRAVIATPKGFSEYITSGKDGIIIPSKNSKELKDAIVSLMENPKKRKAIEESARKKALKYSWEEIANQYLEVFKEAIAPKLKIQKK